MIPTHYVITYPDRDRWQVRQAADVDEAEGVATIACASYGFARIHLWRLGVFEHVVDFDVSSVTPSLMPPMVVPDLGTVQAWKRVAEVLEECFAERRKARAA